MILNANCDGTKILFQMYDNNPAKISILYWFINSLEIIFENVNNVLYLAKMQEYYH